MPNENSPRKIMEAYGFKKVRRVTDEATDTVVDTLRVPLNDGSTRELDLAPSAQTSGKLAARLRDIDACLPPADEEHKALMGAIYAYVPKRRVRYAARAGWADDRKTFILPHTVIGSQADDLVGLSPKIQESGHALASRGTLVDWQNGVAMPAERSSTLTFCMSVSFAAPLLPIIGEQPFGVCVFGASRIGKSRGILAAASIIGIGEQDRVPSWDATRLGLQRLVARFTNLMCPIDDIMNIAMAKGTARSTALEDFAYSLNSGQRRLHSKAYDAEQGRDPNPWSTIVLTSSETALSAERGDKARQKGATVRLIDVPALLTGEDVFDRLETSHDGARSKAVEQILADMTKACARQHGVAFEHYVGFLITHRDTVDAWVHEAVTQFQNHVRHDATDEAMTRDVARKFGLIFAGARMAIRAGTVPWTEENALASVTAAYHAARKLLPDDALELREGIAKLSAGLRDLPSVRKWHRQDAHERPRLTIGYRWRSARAHHCMIRTEAFVGMFSSASQRRAVETYLLSQRRLETAHPKGATAKPTPKMQHVWVNGDRPRSYLIDVPLTGFFAQG